MPNGREAAMDQIERAIAEKAVMVCTERFNSTKFVVSEKKDERGHYLIEWTYTGKTLTFPDGLTMEVAIKYFIEGFRVSAVYWEW